MGLEKRRAKKKKKEQTKYKASRKKKVTNVRVEINKIENWKTINRSMKPKTTCLKRPVENKLFS